MAKAAPPAEDVERAVAELGKGKAPASCRELATRLGWPMLRTSEALLGAWATGRAEPETREPFGWRLKS